MIEWQTLLARQDLGVLRDIVNECYSNIDGLHSTQYLDMNCDWRVAIENALEDVHVNHVHPTSLAKLKIVNIGMERHLNHSIAHYRITDSRYLRGLESVSTHFEHPFPDTYFHMFIFPSTCISTVAGLTYSVQHYIPSGRKTTLKTSLFRGKLKTDAKDMTAFFDSAAAFNKQVFEEDARMCEKVHVRGLLGNPPPPLRRLAWFTEALHD